MEGAIGGREWLPIGPEGEHRVDRHGARGLQPQGDHHDRDDEAAETRDGLLLEDLLHRAARPRRQRAAKHQRQRGRDAHDAEASDLNQDEDDPMTEPAKVARHVDVGEAGDAGRARRDEERREDPGRLPWGSCGRREQHDRARSDREEEAHAQERDRAP
jgi:hypothetical protein